MGTIGLDRLALFVAVTEEGSFSAAAARLGMPKSSVSRGVSQLEQQLGVRLLHRTTRSLALSSAGATLFERIRPQLQAIDRSLDDLPERDDQPSGLLRFTTIPDLGATVVAELLVKFGARYPAVEIDLRLTTRALDLVRDRIDAALRMSQRPLHDSTLSARKLGRLTMGLFASPAYLGERGTPRSPRELAGHQWVVFRLGAPMRLDGPGEPVLPPPRGRLACDDGANLRAAIRAGAGIGVLPSFVAEADVERGQLIPVLPRWKMHGGDLWFVCPSAKQIPRKVVALRSFLAEALASHSVFAG
jgi:DNA-binding transcriptional LysR family regulator